MSISGQGPQGPTYQKDFQESINLFEKSFQGMQTSKFEQQRDQYVKVMNEALQTMQESASGLLNDKLIQQKEGLATDLKEYLKAPTSEQLAKMQEDITKIKESSV